MSKTTSTHYIDSITGEIVMIVEDNIHVIYESKNCKFYDLIKDEVESKIRTIETVYLNPTNRLEKDKIKWYPKE